ncbi:MAG: transglycosylase SLT domain-containing protein [Candidatus Zixiibacteriota bacterium]|nr:MAG: transglycosylase SLT domain-containing protein [candidate division Zixibacteria bacterium]
MTTVRLEKLGLFLSKPLALLFVLIYLSQAVFIVILVQDKFNLEKQIDFQRKRINELEEKLQILQVIEDFQIGFSDEEKAELVKVISSECDKYDYDPLFLMALILTESSFKRGQVSSVGARGLMQIRPFVGRSLADKIGIDWEGAQTLFRPELNIKMGSLHLFEMILKFRDVRKAIVSYNLGETALRSRVRLNKPLPKSFLNKVMKNYEMLKEQYQT